MVSQDNTSAKIALVGDMCMLLVMRICDYLCDAQAPRNLVVSTKNMFTALKQLVFDLAVLRSTLLDT